MATVEQPQAQESDVATFDVENPATGEVIATLPDFGSAEIEELARKGRAAQPGWDAMGFEGRGAVMLRAQKWVNKNADRVIRTVMSETGKTYEDAQTADWTYVLSAFGFWAKNAEKYLADEKVRTSTLALKGKKLVTRFRPYGLIGVIGPWNYPLVNSFGDCIPALMAGNSVILKPSEITPLSSLLMREMFLECGAPEDVFQVATGTGEAGAALIKSVDMIMFTGSTATGRKVGVAAAEQLIPSSLELGGKDPMIVLQDADLDRAAYGAAFWGMVNAGQTCISVERVYVEAPVYDQFVGKVVDYTRKLRNDPSTGPGTSDVGSITFPPQVDTIQRHVDDALAKGARAVVGGKKGHDGKGGYWFEPTILVDVDHSMACMTEETFGPTLPIMKVSDAEEALTLANDSQYGLAASVYGRDTTRAEAVARRVEAGAVCVNDALMNYFALELPMGGWKTSGIGSRHGAGGIRKFSRQQALLVTRFAMKKEIFMYPYKTGVTKQIQKFYKLLYRGK